MDKWGDGDGSDAGGDGMMLVMVCCWCAGDGSDGIVSVWGW